MRCGLCAQVLSDPRKAVCSHLFCAECIAKAEAQTYCPHCALEKPGSQVAVAAKPESDPAGVAALQRVCQQFAELSSFVHKPQPCSFCQERDGVFFCLQCNCFVCFYDRPAHNSSPFHSGHVLRDVAHVERCAEHGQIAIVYCEECETLVCSECICSSHMRHKFVPIASAAASKKQILVQKLRYLEEREGICQLRLQISMRERTAILSQQAKLEKTLDTAAQMHLEIEKAKTEIFLEQETIARVIEEPSDLDLLDPRKFAEVKALLESEMKQQMEQLLPPAASSPASPVTPCSSISVSAPLVSSLTASSPSSTSWYSSIEDEEIDSMFQIGESYHFEKAAKAGSLSPSLIIRFGSKYLPNPLGITRDLTTGNIIVSSTVNHTICIYSPMGHFMKAVGGYGKDACRFANPVGVAVNAKGELLVADSGNNRIQIITQTGEFVAAFGERGCAAGQFRCPVGVAVDRAGRILVVDQINTRVQVFSPQGKHLFMFGGKGQGPGQFSGPTDIVLHPQTADIYVSDSLNDRVQVFNFKGKYIGAIGCSGSAAAQFSNPLGIALDGDNNLAVVDHGNHRVQIFSSKGDYLSEFSVSFPDAISIDNFGNYIVTSQAGGIQIYGELALIHAHKPPPRADLHVAPLKAAKPSSTPSSQPGVKKRGHGYTGSTAAPLHGAHPTHRRRPSFDSKKD